MSGKTYCHTHRVTYAECTVGNHIYYSRYLNLLEESRGEFCRALGQSLLALQNENFIFPVLECRVSYKYPARYDDVLQIELWLTALDRLRLTFAYRILNQSGRLVLQAETTHVCSSIDEKPRRMPKELLPVLEPYLKPAA